MAVIKFEVNPFLGGKSVRITSTWTLVPEEANCMLRTFVRTGSAAVGCYKVALPFAAVSKYVERCISKNKMIDLTEKSHKTVRRFASRKARQG